MEGAVFFDYFLLICQQFLALGNVGTNGVAAVLELCQFVVWQVEFDNVFYAVSADDAWQAYVYIFFTIFALEACAYRDDSLFIVENSAGQGDSDTGNAVFCALLA